MKVDGTVTISIEDFDILREKSIEGVKLVNRIIECCSVISEGGVVPYTVKFDINNFITILEDIISEDMENRMYLNRLPKKESILTLQDDNEIPF